jgi:hypothetical protein
MQEFGYAHTATPGAHMAPAGTVGTHFCCRHLPPDAQSELFSHAAPMGTFWAQTPHDIMLGTWQRCDWHWAPFWHPWPSARGPGLVLQTSRITLLLKSSHDCASTASAHALNDSGVLEMSFTLSHELHQALSCALHDARSPQVHCSENGAQAASLSQYESASR